MSKIHGIGIDICHIPRISKVVRRFGCRFLNRAFHKSEISTYEDYLKGGLQEEGITYLASRWAVKEATFKAFRYGRAQFPDIYLVNTVPSLVLEGSALSIAQQLCIKSSHVSVSHDGDYATAYVIHEI
jgi:holo-[acyl-carrier protein] synthase